MSKLKANSNFRNDLCDNTFRCALNGNETIKSTALYLHYLSLINCGIGLSFCVIGVLSVLYYEYYLLAFGLICTTHLFVGLFSHLAINEGKRLYFVPLILCNLLWIACSLIYCVYLLFLKYLTEFGQNVIFHAILVVYLLTSIALQIYCLALILKIDKHLRQNKSSE